MGINAAQHTGLSQRAHFIPISLPFINLQYRHQQNDSFYFTNLFKVHHVLMMKRSDINDINQQYLLNYKNGNKKCGFFLYPENITWLKNKAIAAIAKVEHKQ